MQSILTTVLPVFGLIILGVVSARLKIVDGSAARGLTQFVFMLAIPAFLFRTVVAMKPQEVAPFSLWIAFFGGLAFTWIATMIASRNVVSLQPSGGASASMAAGFGNQIGRAHV